MERLVTGLAFSYPDKPARAAAQYRRKTPQATVGFELEAGDSLEFSVPSRVARAFEKEAPALPAAYEEVRDALLALDARVCFTTLVDALARRDHAEAEAREKLSAIGFRAASIESALSRAREARFIDDARFARYFIDERTRRGWGRIRIEQELRRRGVDADSVPGYPEEFFSADDDLSRARALLDRKAVPDTRAFEKLVRFLMGKGFPYALARDAVKERLAEE